jgi:hypothetical protein
MPQGGVVLLANGLVDLDLETPGAVNEEKEEGEARGIL